MAGQQHMVQHLMQIDLKGWGGGYASSFQKICLFQMLNSVAEHESLLLQQPLLQQEKNPQLEKLKAFKTNPSILNSNRPQKPIAPIQQEQSLPPPNALHAAVTTSKVSNDSTAAP
ncbi:hypothetical protein POM88_016713 [Heracleum sosnowskyi]|uniref:Uncharacterized protein n=1 Tax=Heracleum sosnowskyi TaxID=360622 RepID=A0AAD8IMR8_9APIA|nr:hypothetical protein POM88_016713 [Heracleum sosnowskyi]